MQGRLDLFFLLLAGLMAANLALYLWVAARYEYKAVEHVKRVTLPRAQRQVRSCCVCWPAAALRWARCKIRAAFTSGGSLAAVW